MSRGYYYLISALPELGLTDKQLEFDMISYRDFIHGELAPEDANLLKILYYQYDIINLVHLIKESGTPWEKAGNYTKLEMEEMLALPDSLPLFMKSFVEDTQARWPSASVKQLVNLATWKFIDWSRYAPNSFLRKWLRFDQNLKNLLIWLNSYKFGLDPAGEVLGSHFEAEYLRQSKPDELNLKAWDFRYREVLTHFDNPNVALREYIIDEMRWHYLSELEEAFSFGIERLLAFVIRLQIINRNLQNTETSGRKHLLKLLTEIRQGYDMPDSFQDISVYGTRHEPDLQALITADNVQPETE